MLFMYVKNNLVIIYIFVDTPKTFTKILNGLYSFICQLLWCQNLRSRYVLFVNV